MMANPSFSAAVPELQIAWDSTSIGALKKCPRFYELSIVQGWAPRQESVHLRFGLLYHGALERYHHFKAQGETHSVSMRRVVRWVLEETWDAELGRPWFSDDPNKNRGTLLRTVVWYLLQFGEADPFQTIILATGKPAVELSFRLELNYSSHLSGEAFQLCGHLDRVVTFQDQAYVVDAKTTKHTLDDKYFSQFSPDNQFSCYTFGGKIVYSVPIQGLIVDAAQVAVGFTRFERRPIPRHQSQLDEWHRDLGFWLTTAQMHAKAKYWPQNDKSCFLCHFKEICGRPPANREQWLAAGFVKRLWNPLEARGDI